MHTRYLLGTPRSHLVGVCGMNSTKRGCWSVQAWDTCRDVSSLLTKQAAIGKPGSQLKAGSPYQQVALLGITSHPFIHEDPARAFISGQVVVVVSQSQVKVCVFFFFSVFCQVLCASVHCVLLWLYIYMPECLPLDVHDSVCTSVSETASTACHMGEGGL